MTKVALVATVRDEADTIGSLLASIDAQSVAPDEIVIVDGGSSDGTLSLLEDWARDRHTARIVIAPGFTIAAGRNVAIAGTSADLIAVTDAGCVLDREWLSRLTAVLSEADVAMGYYTPLTESWFERLSACLTVPDADEVVPTRFMPSSRSIAFARSVWERAGGYPEALEIGEDMAFDFRMLEAIPHLRRRFVPEAVVAWRPRSTVTGFAKQYFRYAKGDGLARMYPRRHLARFVAYTGALLMFAVSLSRPLVIALPAAAAGLWLAPASRRVWRRLPDRRAMGIAVLPLLAVLMDLAKMSGYISGRLRRRVR